MPTHRDRHRRINSKRPNAAGLALGVTLLTKKGTTGGSPLTTAALTPTGGGVLVAFVYSNNSGTLDSIGGTVGGTWTVQQDGNVDSGGTGAKLTFATCLGYGSGTVVATDAASTNISATVLEVGGVATSGDVTRTSIYAQSIVGPDTSLSTGAMAGHADGSVIIYGASFSNASTGLTPPAGYTQLVDESIDSAGHTAVGYITSSASATVTCTHAIFRAPKAILAIEFNSPA